MANKKDLISKIEKQILGNDEEIHSCDLDHTPILMSNKHTSQCVETFNHDSATVFFYVNDVETSQTEVLYKDLPKRVLEEILTLLQERQ
jgi:hypothetical protein